MFANPRTFSQLTASFIVARSLGIRRLPLFAFSREIVFTQFTYTLLIVRTTRVVLRFVFFSRMSDSLY